MVYEKSKIQIVLAIIHTLVLFMHVPQVWAAVGCTLNDPDRDIKRIFPTSTGYKTQFITIKEHGGESLAKEIERKLGDPLDVRYESLDVPYAYYTVLKGKEIIGYMHGINQKGIYGGMQLILATDLEGIVKVFYYQKLSSPEAAVFRDKAFADQFIGLSLKDFYHHDKLNGMLNPRDSIAKINNPSKNSHEDFLATLRGIKKNLILFDEFILNNRYDKYYYTDRGGKENESKQ